MRPLFVCLFLVAALAFAGERVRATRPAKALDVEASGVYTEFKSDGGCTQRASYSLTPRDQPVLPVERTLDKDTCAKMRGIGRTDAAKDLAGVP